MPTIYFRRYPDPSKWAFVIFEYIFRGFGAAVPNCMATMLRVLRKNPMTR